MLFCLIFGMIQLQKFPVAFKILLQQLFLIFLDYWLPALCSAELTAEKIASPGSDQQHTAPGAVVPQSWFMSVGRECHAFQVLLLLHMYR